MKLIETPFWSLPLSEEWQTETDEDTIIVFDEDGVGSLEFTVLEFDDGEPGPQDLDALAQQIIPDGIAGVAAECGAWRGLRFEYVEDEDCCRDWLLLCQQKVLLVSYTCELDDRGMDDGAIDEILSDLRGRDES